MSKNVLILLITQVNYFLLEFDMKSWFSLRFLQVFLAKQFIKFFQTHCVSYTASILLTELCLSTDGKWPICLSELHEKNEL